MAAGGVVYSAAAMADERRRRNFRFRARKNKITAAICPNPPELEERADDATEERNQKAGRHTMSRICHVAVNFRWRHSVNLYTENIDKGADWPKKTDIFYTCSQNQQSYHINRYR